VISYAFVVAHDRFRIMSSTKTTTPFNRLDPRQPSERDIYTAANTLIENMGYGDALVHAQDMAIQFQKERQANVAWTRIMRAIKVLRIELE